MADHRSLQTPVRNQGNRPTCVGFAVSAAHEWMAADVVVLSPEDAIWAAHQEGGPQAREDTSVRLALAGLHRLEHAYESAWPYGAPAWPASRTVDAQKAECRAALPEWRE